MALNLPNILTIARLLIIPFFAYLALSPQPVYQVIAALLFGIAALTDWLDGYLARKLNQMTEFGAVADPFIDRIFIAVGLVVLYLKINEFVPLWVIALIIGRDVIMLIGWVMLKGRNIPMKVTYEGKVATAFLMSAMYVLLIAPVLQITILIYGAIFAFYIGVILCVFSGVRYIKSGLRLVNSHPKKT